MRLFCMLFVLFGVALHISAQEYLLGPGDVIEISVTDLEEINGKYRISNMGYVELPYLKSIQVQGLTISQLKKKLEADLRANYLNDPQVLIKLDEVRSNPISMIGAVQRPGILQNSIEVDLLQAISLVGGRTANSGKRALIIRKGASGETATLEINLDKLLSEGSPHLNIPLFAGDTVNIPPQKMINIYVTGEVNGPGELKLSDADKITLLRVISKAGGFTDYAKQKKVIVRRDSKGKQEEFVVDVKAIKAGKSQDFYLKANDVIIVP
ncbi:MAG: hypothetical protein CSA81_08725 [Acidobacteria bacterium]|nr:MAG: hypothetical protein CSA81_08725 [Acidobacteriota bacterium]